jgi:arylsulfatase A-like enzyme
MPFDVVTGEERQACFVLRRSNPGGPVDCRLRGRSLGRVQPGPRGWSFCIAVPSGLLRPGRNVMELNGASGLELSQFRVTPLRPAQRRAHSPRAPSRANGDLTLPPGTAIRFDLRLPAAAELRFGLDAQPAPEAATVSVERPGVDPGASVLWSLQDAAPDVSVSVRLDPYAGQVVRLALAAGGVPGGPPVRWRNPEVLGRWPEVVQAHSGPSTGPRPEAEVVVLILLDAAAAAHFGSYGAPRCATPNLDRLARDGLQIETAYTQASWTLPSVATLMTGLYPATHRISHFNHTLTPAADTLAEQAQRRGFRTLLLTQHPGLATKVHLAQGFESAQRVPLDLAGFREAIERWIPQRPPFFLYLHLLPPHAPYRAPRPYPSLFADPSYTGDIDGSGPDLSRIQNRIALPEPADVDQIRALYTANLRYADALVGETLGLLRHRGLYARSAVVATADHGEGLWEHERLFHGALLHEEVCRIPLVLRLPGRERGLRPGLFEAIRLHATLQQLMGLPRAAAAAGGPSLLDRVAEPQTGVLTSYPYRGHGTRLAWRRGRHAYLYSALGPRRELFDRISDPAELNDLAPSNPALVAELHAELTEAIVRHVTMSERFGTPDEIQLDKQTEEELRGLGYVE